MSGVTASLCSTLLFLGVFVLVSADQKLITAESGQDVTLPCRAPNNNKIIVLEWSRADLGDKKIIFYRDGKFVPAIQHPSFKNRVDLQDRQMKDGDVSLILKNVTTADAGTYECRVYMEGTQSWQLSSIELRVDPPDQKLITAESGQDVTLTCRAPNNNKIIVLEWSRAELGDKNILLYRNGKFAPATQHPSFKNRVDLQDRQMKDGDVSLILNNVTINYTGTYECHVYMEETSSWKSISFIYLSVVPPDQKIITAESGQDVTLTCRAPNNNIIVVKWSRADLGDEYVLLYRDEVFVPATQHPSFKNRVDLQDRQMKDGDVSLILKNVMINDTGTYECGVAQKEPNQERASLKLISSIYLSVDPPGQTAELTVAPVGLIAGLSVPAVLLVAAVVGFLIYRRRKLNPADPHEAEHLQPPQPECESDEQTQR